MNTYKEFQSWEKKIEESCQLGVTYPKCFKKFTSRIQKRLQKEYIHLIIHLELSVDEAVQYTQMNRVSIREDFQKLVDCGICEYVVQKRKVGTIIRLKEDHTILMTKQIEDTLKWHLKFYSKILQKRIQELNHMKNRKIKTIEIE